MTQGVKFHRNEAQTVYRLATGEITWNTLNEKEKRSIAWNPEFAQAIDNSNANIVPVIAFNRFIDYIRRDCRKST
jgi:2-hydroxychromene-2-carboxylate isomerase